jgi:hypothetical protein
MAISSPNFSVPLLTKIGEGQTPAMSSVSSTPAKQPHHTKPNSSSDENSSNSSSEGKKAVSTTNTTTSLLTPPLPFHHQQQQQQKKQQTNNNTKGSTINGIKTISSAETDLDEWDLIEGEEYETSGSGGKQKTDVDVDVDPEEDMMKIIEQYSEKKRLENEQMLKDLELTSWVDEVCFPSTLMILKSVGLALFGLFISAYEITKPEYADLSAWQKYNAYAANIINGAVFSSWLDIGVQYFVFYSTQSDIYRKSVKISALGPGFGMSEYVKMMFLPNKEHPAYKFFKYCSAARWGVNICWVIYIAPYITHICMAFFYYLPMVIVYSTTMVFGGGILTVIIAKVLDLYGDTWRDEFNRQKKEDEEEAEREKKEAEEKEKKRKNNKNKNNITSNGAAVVGQEQQTQNAPKTTKRPRKNLFWLQARSFLARYLFMVLYSILVYYLYSLHCNWAALLYEQPERYGGLSGYLLVVWDELSIRQMSCQILLMQEAFRTNDKIGMTDVILGFI